VLQHPVLFSGWRMSNKHSWIFVVLWLLALAWVARGQCPPDYYSYEYGDIRVVDQVITYQSEVEKSGAVNIVQIPMLGNWPNSVPLFEGNYLGPRYFGEQFRKVMNMRGMKVHGYTNNFALTNEISGTTYWSIAEYDYTTSGVAGSLGLAGEIVQAAFESNAYPTRLTNEVDWFVEDLHSLMYFTNDGSGGTMNYGVMPNRKTQEYVRVQEAYYLESPNVTTSLLYYWDDKGATQNTRYFTKYGLSNHYGSISQSIYTVEYASLTNQYYQQWVHGYYIQYVGGGCDTIVHDLGEWWASYETNTGVDIHQTWNVSNDVVWTFTFPTGAWAALEE